MFWWIGTVREARAVFELGSESVSLAATSPTAAVERIRFRDLGRVFLDRGRCTSSGSELPSVRIGSLDTPGTLRELGGAPLAVRARDSAREVREGEREKTTGAAR